MSILFDDASSEYLEIDVAIVPDAPCTMAAWMYPDVTDINPCVFYIGNKDSNNDRMFLYLNAAPTSNVVVYTVNAAGTGGYALTSSKYSANVWQHVCGVWAASNDRRVFLNGGGKGTDTTDLSLTAPSRTSIGRVGRLTPAGYFSGRICEVGFWNVGLSDDEVAILAKGFSPLFVRPENLVAYYPLVRSMTQDVVGGNSMVAYNTPTVAEHVPIIYPVRPQIIFKKTVTGGIDVSALSNTLLDTLLALKSEYNVSSLSGSVLASLMALKSGSDLSSLSSAILDTLLELKSGAGLSGLSDSVLDSLLEIKSSSDVSGLLNAVLVSALALRQGFFVSTVSNSELLSLLSLKSGYDVSALSESELLTALFLKAGFRVSGLSDSVLNALLSLTIPAGVNVSGLSDAVLMALLNITGGLVNVEVLSLLSAITKTVDHQSDINKLLNKYSLITVMLDKESTI